MTKTVVILCGPRASYGFCPVPPLTNSAPERNIFRLAEFDYGGEFELHVMSACSRSQRTTLAQRSYSGHYHHIVFPERVLSLSKKRLFQNRVAQKLCQRWCYTNDLFGWIYLHFACKEIKHIQPSLILINSLPQYIRFVRHYFPETPLGLFVRGEMGSSRKYLPLVNFVIANSAGIAQYVQDLLGGVPIPVKVIPNSLELSYCAGEKQRSVCRPKKRLIFLGRVAKEKGVLELLHAFHKVQRSEPDAELAIVGGNFPRGPFSTYEREVLEYATVNHLNVKFVGRVPNDETANMFRDASIAVFPSIWLESFGMVALEAMRCGLPIVASKRPGFEDLIVPGETGILVDNPEDTDALADAIIKLLNCPKLEKMGDAGYRRSLEYTPEVINKRFKQIILDVLHT